MSVEVTGDTWKEYILTIVFNELMKGGSNYNEPIYFGYVFNRNIALHIVCEVTPERHQPIQSSCVPNQQSCSGILTVTILEYPIL